MHARSLRADSRRSHWFLHILQALWFLKEISRVVKKQYLQVTLNHLQWGNMRTFFFSFSFKEKVVMVMVVVVVVVFWV